MKPDVDDLGLGDEVLFGEWPARNDELGRFAAELYGDAERGELSFVYGKSANRVSWHGLDLTALAAAARRQTSNVWVPIGSRHTRLADGKRGGVEDVLDVFAVAADLDVLCTHHTRADLPPTLDDARTLLGDFPLAPTVVVVTGGGLQAWWFLAEPCPAGDAAEVLGRWGANWRELGRRRHWHVDSTSSLDHVFRLPGTRNAATGTLVTVESADYRRRYGLDDLDECCVPETLPPRPKPQPRPRVDGEPLAGDRYNAKHTCDELLEAEGCVLSHITRAGDRHYFAPHRAESRERCGATVYTDGHCAIWSETFASRRGLVTATEGVTYDAFGLFAHLRHGGDFSAAAKAIAAVDPPPRHQPPPDDEAPPPGEEEAHASPRNLPDEFWTRPELAVIRQAAHAKARSADAVLGAVLARISMLIPPTMRVDTGVVIPAPLNTYVGLVAQSGGGKTSAAAVARDLVPIDRTDLVVDMPMGSGEGAIEMFYEWLLEDQPDGKKIKVKRRTKTGVLLTLDEGQALSELGGRNGAVLLPVLRSAWSGETIGQTNAREETKRRVEAHTYRLSLIVGFQAAAAGTLLADQKRGTAQRFVLFSTVDPAIPDTAPHWPIEKVLATVPATAPEMLITVVAEVATEIRTRALAVARGQRTLDPLDSHRDQCRARIGGLLAILAGRRQVTVDDWKLAGMILDTSDAVRRWVLDTNAAVENQREDDRTRAAVKRQRLAAKALDDDLHGRAVLAGARAIARLAHRRNGETVTAREAHHAVTGKHRHEAGVDEMLDYAVEKNWIRGDGDGWVAGSSKPA